MSENEKNAVAPFMERSELNAEELRDEQRQQAEADTAKQALAYLNESADAEDDDEESEDEDAAPEPVSKPAADNDAKRREHEQSEARRKAEWEARQKAKKDAEEQTLREIAAMTETQAEQASLSKIRTGVERLTRRNMKECVSEYVQTSCLSDAAFRLKVLSPRKNMLSCFKYINKKAQAYLKEEFELNGETASGFQGGDVPDELCYEWAEEYFGDPNAEEDKDKDDTFTPKQFYGGSSSKSKKKEPIKPKLEPVKQTAPEQLDLQMSLTGAM